MSLLCECLSHPGHDVADYEVKRHGRRMFVCGNCTSGAGTQQREIAQVPPFNVCPPTSNAKWMRSGLA